jgi:oligoendopeptidase F
VYSYAGGLLISKNLQQQVRNDHRAIEKVKEFLAAGRSESPKNIFKKLGIDMTKPLFWKDGLRAVDEELKRLEALAKRMKKV